MGIERALSATFGEALKGVVQVGGLARGRKSDLFVPRKPVILIRVVYTAFHAVC